MNATELRRRMDHIASEPEPRRRRILALAILSERLRADGIVPILVGGAALEFYTSGGYATKDMDLALPACPEVGAAFAELGFDKIGRYWLRDDLDLLFEAPAPAGLPGETAPRTIVRIDGMSATIIGIEDLLLDRLRAWIHWNSPEDERWTRRLALLFADRLDWQYLRERAAGVKEEGEAVEQIFDEAN